MQYYTLKVVRLNFETDDTLTISFKQPGLKKIKYLAGQYLTIVLYINNRRYLRPYSFSSAPGIDSTLDITVKRVFGGIASNHIIDNLKVDDMIEVMEPIGDFTLESKPIIPQSSIILWGAGSGITPLISIAKYALHNKLVQKVILVYGNKAFDSVIFNGKIKNLENHFHDTFLVWHFHTQGIAEENNPFQVQGRIDPNKVLDGIKSNLSNTFHYICGPEGLKNSVKKTLFELNINSNQICIEDFVVVRDPMEFEDIKTRNVLIKKNGQTYNIEVVKGKSILEAGLDCLIDLSYSCQTGNCLVCRGRTLKGKVKMIGAEEISKVLGIDECLLCSSFPVSDDIEIEVE